MIWLVRSKRQSVPLQPRLTCQKLKQGNLVFLDRNSALLV